MTQACQSFQEGLTLKEEAAGVMVGSNALEECEGITDAVGSVGCEGGGREQWVDGNDFLQQSNDSPKAVPEIGSELWKCFSLLAEL